MPQLTDDWKVVLRHAWSVRFIAAAALLSGVEFVLPIFMDNPPISRGAFAVLAFLASIAAAIARFVAQKEVP